MKRRHHIKTRRIIDLFKKQGVKAYDATSLIRHNTLMDFNDEEEFVWLIRNTESTRDIFENADDKEIVIIFNGRSITCMFDEVNEKLLEEFIENSCKICFDDDFDDAIVCENCKVMMCLECIGRLRDYKCPFCRENMFGIDDFMVMPPEIFFPIYKMIMTSME